MVEQIIENLVKATSGDPDTARSLWQEHLDDLLLRRADLPVQTIADAAAAMLAKARTSQKPFAFDRATSYLRRGIQMVATENAKASTSSGSRRQPAKAWGLL